MKTLPLVPHVGGTQASAVQEDGQGSQTTLMGRDEAHDPRERRDRNDLEMAQTRAWLRDATTDATTIEAAARMVDELVCRPDGFVLPVCRHATPQC